jgi:cardiolipin synthase A/B
MKNKYPILLFWTTLCGLILTTAFWIGLSAFYIRIPLPQKPVELYSTETGDDLQLTFTKVIGEAQESILLMIYSLTDQRIIKALRNRSEQGVEVRVICDAKASKGVYLKLGQFVKVYFRGGKGLMHQKILVVDSKKVWIGSANMTTTSLKMHGNLVAGFDSPELAEVIYSKAEMMTHIGLVEKIQVSELTIGNQEVEMWFFPDNPHGPEKIRKLIQTAQKSIKVAMFTWTRFDIVKDIAASMQRGVKVEVVIDRNSASSTSAKIVEELHQLGIPVRLSQGIGLLHHKFMIIDDSILVNGSANWTLAAFTENDDCFVVMHPLNKDQIHFLEKLWNAILINSEKYIPHHGKI